MLSKLFKSLRGGKSDGGPTPEIWSESPAFDHHAPQNFAAGGAYASDDLVRQFQHDRNSYAIGLIHRHQNPRESFEQWYFDAMIGEHHLQDFMAALQSVPSDAKLDIILHSVGGFMLFVQQIARAIKAHKGETTVFVPHYAQHYATLIALAGDKIVMGPAASLSYIEPMDNILQHVVRQKGVRRAQDLTVMRLSITKNAGRELRGFVGELVTGTASSPSKTVNELTGGKRSPWDPLTPAHARQAGLPVSTDMPFELYRIIQACRAAPQRDTGVKTVERSVSAKRASLMLASDLETCMLHGVNVAPFDNPQMLRRDVAPAPKTDASDDDDGDPSGVSLESCDITIRPLIAKLEQSRNSRVICIVHQAGMESNSVDTITTEDVLTALQQTPADKPLDIVLHTPGGDSFEAHQIALAIKAHPARKTVFVPFFAMSGGTIISLAADEIVLAPNAVIGPIDAQFPVFHLQRMMPTRAILDLLSAKPTHRIHDELLTLGVHCKRTIVQDHKNAVELMRGTYSPSVSERVVHRLNDGTLTHGYPVTITEAKQLGLNISGGLPVEATAIVRAYRRNRFGKRSVVFCG